MDELYVYALLCSAGFDEFLNFEFVLNELFLKNPDNDEFLDLMGRSDKDTLLQVLSLMNTHPLDQDHFGKCFMSALKPIYFVESLHEFYKCTNKLWTLLPEDLRYTEPFFILCYAGEPLDYGDEKTCRELYEKALNYYSGR